MIVGNFCGVGEELGPHKMKRIQLGEGREAEEEEGMGVRGDYGGF